MPLAARHLPDSDDELLVDQAAHDLLEEERVSSARRGSAVRLGGEAVDVQEHAHHVVGVVGAEGLERDARCAATPASPARPAGRELGSGRAQEHHRRRDAVGQLLEEVEHGAVGPVDVLDDHDERVVAREGGEEAAPADVDLVHHRSR
jgi:hypothetical protein